MIDLHTHSTASDGTLSPAQLLEHAAARGLCGLALTDHDTLAGIEEARSAAGAHGIRFLAGIELSTVWGDSNVHLLGYGVDGANNAALQTACSGMREARRQRAERMVAQLRAAGVPVRLEAVMAEAAGAVGRPHVARVLVAEGWARDLKEAFQRWLVPGAAGYVNYERLAAGAATQLLRAVGGVPVLAHPGALKLHASRLEKLVEQLCEDGLAGIEAYWAQHTPNCVALCERIAAQHRLLTTGGSDFHGANKPGIELGMSAGERGLNPDLMDAIEARRGISGRSEC